MQAFRTPEDMPRVVALALAEDLGDGDLTGALVAPERNAAARLVCRESAVICGIAWFEESFRKLSDQIRFEWTITEGDSVAPDSEICRIVGPSCALLAGERTALNFLQTLSATATTTRRFVDAIKGTRTRILDTRKTLPVLRQAQKYAVLVGGGQNHRMGLYDSVLIKENHILALGSIHAAVQAARERYPDVTIEVEVESLDELQEALAAKADIVMLDDFTLDDMRGAVAITQGRCKLEVSGGVNLESLKKIADTGVDYVSIGSLTKNISAIDLSLRFESETLVRTAHPT